MRCRGLPTCSCATRRRCSRSIHCLSCADGSWVAGDVKLVIDDNAIVRQPAIRALLEQHPGIYPESARKLVTRLRLCRGRPAGRDRADHHRRRPEHAAHRRAEGPRPPAAELLRHPLRPVPRRSGAPDRRDAMDRGAAERAGRAGEYLCRHHRLGRIRAAPGAGGGRRCRSCACRSSRG